MEKSYKTPLYDVAFLLIARFDTIVRLENAVHVARFLADNFDTHVYLWECDSFNNGFLERLLPSNVRYVFKEDHDPILHRTKYINQMVLSVNEPFVSVWDVDVVANPSQIIKAVEMLRQGADFVYPYEKYLLDTSAVLRREYLKQGDLRVLEDYWRFMREMYPPNPVGGAFLANKESYIRSGLENENFYGWGIEDGERFVRWRNMGFVIERINGPIFHLSHPRGINSAIPHPVFSVAKHREYLKTIRKK